MKITNEIFSKQIDFSTDDIWFLIVENPSYYYKYANMLLHQFYGEEGDFVLSNNNKILSFEKDSLVLYDYFNFKVDSKPVINSLNKSILSYIQNNDFIVEFDKINKTISDLLLNIKDNFDIPIVSSGEFTQDNFIKLMNFEVETKSVLLDNLLSVIDVYIKLKNINVFIFINVSSVLSKDEFDALIKQLKYQDIKVLFIEPLIKYNMLNYSHIIIDEDLCEL